MFDTLDKGVDEGVIVSAAHALMPPAEISGIGKESGVVRTGIQHNREGLRGMDASAECIEGKLANGDSHATEAEVAQTKDALAIRDDNDTHIAMPDALQDAVDLSMLRIRDIEAARLAIDVAVVFAGFTDLRRINDRAHLANVLLQEPIKEGFIPILQRREEDVRSRSVSLRL